jgi:hypothetical protein
MRKWNEAFQCKECNTIHTYRDKINDDYCKSCGIHLFHVLYSSPLLRNDRVPRMKHATKNVRPVIIRRKWFKWEVKPSSRTESFIQGKPPPWD